MKTALVAPAQSRIEEIEGVSVFEYLQTTDVAVSIYLPGTETHLGDVLYHEEGGWCSSANLDEQALDLIEKCLSIGWAEGTADNLYDWRVNP